MRSAPFNTTALCLTQIQGQQRQVISFANSLGDSGNRRELAAFPVFFGTLGFSVGDKRETESSSGFRSPVLQELRCVLKSSN